MVIGIAVSLYQWRDPRVPNQFYLGEIGRWIATRATPFLLATGAVQLVAMAMVPDAPKEVTQLVWLFAIGEMAGKVADGLRLMGVPVPAFLGSKPKPETESAP